MDGEATHHDSSLFGGSGLGGIQMMGIVNALKTGDARLDMILAMCIPFVIRFVFDLMTNFEKYLQWNYWKDWMEKNRQMQERFITQRSTISSWGAIIQLDDDSKNTVLLKGIRLYLHSQIKLNLKNADINLTSTEDKSANLGQSYYGHDDDGDADSRTVVGILSGFRIVKEPLKNQWHKLGVFGPDNKSKSMVELHIWDNQSETTSGEAGKSAKEITRTYRFRSLKGDAIDHFIDTAYEWYMKELKKEEDNARYLYELKTSFKASTSNVDDSGDSQGGCVYKRYRLSDEKTFDSLFFQQKESLLNVVNHFQEKSGKYAIKGYPHKRTYHLNCSQTTNAS
jgi:mitochondrial chaperone BCS1